MFLFVLSARGAAEPWRLPGDNEADVLAGLGGLYHSRHDIHDHHVEVAPPVLPDTEIESAFNSD